MSTDKPKSESTRKSVEILHLAMPRTGSLSMMAAYRLLGYTTYHGFDATASRPHQAIWDRAVEGKFGRAPPFTLADWEDEKFLGPYQVLSDCPTIFFTAEFLELWPEAKVVLVERDVDKWEASFQRQIVPSPFTWQAVILRKVFDPWLSARFASTVWTCIQDYFHCHDQESFGRNARETYLRHNEWIKNNVPKDKLLVYNLGSGWRPLCDFLGKDVPDEPFPWLNEGKEFEIWLRKIQTDVVMNGLKTTGWTLGPPACIALVAWVMWRLI